MVQMMGMRGNSMSRLHVMEIDETHIDTSAHTPSQSTMRRHSSGLPMTDDEQRERRASIRQIMEDTSLSAVEKRRSIQSLMDGRRRSSGASIPGSVDSMSMMAAAAKAAADFYDSSSDEDSLMDDEPDEIQPSQGTETESVVSSGSHDNNSGSEMRLTFRRRGRSSSLKNFAEGTAAAAVAAAAAAAAQVSDDPDDVINSNRRMEKSRPNCEHYERNCSIISPCCGLAFGCRICHDECPVLPPPFNQRQSEDQSNWKESMDIGKNKPQLKKRRSLPIEFEEVETHHQIDRFAIAEVICRQCFTRQSSKTNNCIKCQVQFGEYYCNICNLWMSEEEDPYHCADCGFCRVGGRDSFRHCHDCGMCIDALLFEDHNCKAGKYMSNCPVCQEDLFSSRSASHEMPCGHAIHWHCFKELTSYDTRCPVCKKTAESHEQMAPTWSAMAMGIALQPVPPEMARAVTIICNDCEERDEDRRWHFLGVQCRRCSSFNSTVERTTLIGHAAAEHLDNLDNARQAMMGGIDLSGFAQPMEEDTPFSDL